MYYGAIAGFSAVAASLAEKGLDVEYTWIYARRFDFECRKDAFEWTVHRIEEHKMCSYFKQVDNDEEDYYVQVDKAYDSGETYSPQLAIATLPSYEVIEDCEVPDFVVGTWPNYPADYLSSS